VESGGKARHDSVPDVERLPSVSAPVVRSSNGDGESLCGGSGAVSTERAPDDFRRAEQFAEERALRNLPGRNPSFLLAVAVGTSNRPKRIGGVSWVIRRSLVRCSNLS
jgi:hypothetical protein